MLLYFFVVFFLQPPSLSRPPAATPRQPTVVGRGFAAVAGVIGAQGAVLVVPALPAETRRLLDAAHHPGSPPEALRAADRLLVLAHHLVLAVRRRALQVGVGVGRLICKGNRGETV